MKRVTTVIVNYRLKYFLEQTLLSVREAYSEIPGQTIVIDNNSGDDSIEFLKPRFPEVKFICNNKNVGFGKANNQGFELADTDYILVLNPDTIIGKNTIKETVEWMDTHADCASIGVKMVDGNGKFLPESKRSFPSIWNSFCKLFGLSTLFPHSRTFARYHLRYLDENNVHKVPVLAGAFMLLRTELVKKVGGFDEDFFMYGEDMDLSYRMMVDGMSNYYLPTPIIHYKGECTKTNSINYIKMFYEAMLIFYRKHYKRNGWLCKALIYTAIGLRSCVSAISKKIINPISSLLKSSSKEAPTYIVSLNPEDIKSVLGKEGFQTQSVHIISDLSLLPKDDKHQNIILDDRDSDYNTLITSIIANNGDKRYFHIYSGRNNIIISPKAQR